MKKIKPDEYFSNGLIEAARFGNTVVTHNNMTEDLHKEWISGLADHYTEEKEKIDVIIEKIKEKLAKVDPLTLFNFLTSMNSMMLMSPELTTESEIPADISFQLRSVEYVQSLLVSMEHDKANEIEEDKLAEQLSNGARQQALLRHDPERISQTLIKIYKQIIHESNP